MAENKTRETTASVAEFIAGVDEPQKRADAQAIMRLMQHATGKKAALWGPSIIGFGSYHYVYASGREGDMPVVGFSPRKVAIVLYGLINAAGAEALLAKLGKHATGKGCLYIRKLADVDEAVLAKLIDNAAHRKTQTV
ncbi:MAG TPA: DUF1801 domain-containing protein [Rudaea sp.]|jgi:hypothetical protein